MKKLLLSLFAASALFGSASAATTREFTVAASNVDGLPHIVHIEALGIIKKDIEMNKDGSQEPGARRMGELFKNSGWDIIGLSEDFNYHEYIMEEASQYYKASTHRGKIEQGNLSGSVAGYLTQSVHMKTDGLCLLSRKKTQVLDEQIVAWNDHYGYDDHEADGLIDKGYRFYQVCLDGDLIVDVYIMHMDAGDDSGDIGARTKQLKQLAAAIKASNNENPIIILGDTNCRYTRDTLKEDLIDAINADPRFTIMDPWIEYMWAEEGGFDAPQLQLGQGSIMTHTYGEQKGEVVDKIFYINNTDSECTLSCTGYLHDDSFTYVDGSQIADHFPVVATMVIEGPDVPELPGWEYPELQGTKEAVVSGKTYFLRNLGSGEFLRAGGEWTTQAVMGDYPSKVIPTQKSGDKFTLKTTHDNKWIRWNGSNYFMDQAENEWTLTQVDKNIYTLTDASGQAVSHANGVMAPAATADPTDPNQQWEFLTDLNLIDEIYHASITEPKDATFLMKAPDFGFCDQEIAMWETSNNWMGKWEKIRIDTYNNISLYKGYDSSKGGTFSLKQIISGLPAGIYQVTFQARGFNWITSNMSFLFNSEQFSDLDDNISNDPGKEAIIKDFADGKYKREITIEVSSTGIYANKIEIVLNKTSTSSIKGIYLDNFNIKCIAIEGKPDEAVYARVKTAIDDARAKAAEAGIPFNNRVVEKEWRNQEISGDGWSQVKTTYQNLAEAVLNRKIIPADYTYAIINPSFELYPDFKDNRYNIGGGFPFAWNYPTQFAYDSGVWPASDNDKRTDNPDGEYIFNTWDWGDGGNAVYQDIKLIPGIYELSAMVASDNGNTVYLFAGNDAAYKAAVTTVGSNQLVPVKLRFPYTGNDNIRIGVAGAKDGNFALEGGRWYKADNFRLTRVGDEKVIEGLNMLHYAVDDASTKSEKHGRPLDLSKYQDMLDNYTLEGDGYTEFLEVYGLLRDLVFYRDETGKNVDMTDAIINNSFEWGNLYGWDYVPEGDTKVVASGTSTNGTYYVSNRQGTYLYNTWIDGSAYPITQTIYGMRAGEYTLTAWVASDENKKFSLVANGQQGDVLTTTSKTKLIQTKVTFNVAADGDIVTFGLHPADDAGGVHYEKGPWYKVDCFKLTRNGEPNMTLFYDYLKKAIDYTTALAKQLPEEYSSQWDKKIEKIYAIAYDPNVVLEGDGTKEANQLYVILRELTYSQNEPGADMTAAIINNSFELADCTGWNMEHIGDTSVKHNDGVFKVDNCDGEYLYNTYDGPDVGKPIYQLVPGLPKGIYRVEAGLTSYGDRTVELFADDEVCSLVIPSGVDREKTLYPASVEIIITEDNTDITIGARSVNSWFKADNFRLTLVGKFIELEKLHKPVTSFAQLVPNGEFIIAAPHHSGHHTLAANDKAVRALNDGENISHVVDAHIYTLKRIDGSRSRFELVLPGVPQSGMQKVISNNNLYITYENEGEDAVVTTAAGAPVKFDPLTKTFGTDNNHTEATKVYTSSYNDDLLTGVENVIADDNDGEAVFYDLQGIRVDKPGNGIYIMKKGDRVTKVLIKR